MVAEGIVLFCLCKIVGKRYCVVLVDISWNLIEPGEAALQNIKKCDLKQFHLVMKACLSQSTRISAPRTSRQSGARVQKLSSLQPYLEKRNE